MQTLRPPPRKARARTRHARSGARRGLAALIVPTLLSASAPALANGRYPAAGLIAVAPGDPSRLLVRATYGILTTRDGGARWSWTCEAAVGFGGYEDPMISFLADGTILAGLFKGLSVSKDGGCNWAFAGGDLSERFVTDLSVDRADPSKAVLVVSNGLSAGRFLTQLWETGDGGATFTQAGVDLPEDFLALTVDSAPSDPARVYVSGRFGAPGYLGALQRSADRGRTWERLDVPGSDDTHLPYLSAIDPRDADVLYVRLDGDPNDALLVSRDGGRSFSTVLESQGNLSGFALSPDGATVVVGGPADGLFRAPASSLEFEKISSARVQCLTWVDAGLFACGDEFTDGFTGAVSMDQGLSFSPILHLDGLCGPLECAPDSGMASTCEPLWGPTKLAIGAKDCDGGAGGASGSAGGGSGAGGGGSCSDDGCRVADGGAALGAATGRAALLTLAAAAALALAIRRAARGAPRSSPP